MVVGQKLITVEEFEAILADMEDGQERLIELINGEMIEKMPSMLHALVAGLLNGFLFVYFQSNPIGWLFSELRTKKADDAHNSLIPDICVVLKAGRELKQFDLNKPLPFMPDLAIEIQSPDQSEKLMAEKGAYYLGNGSHLVWLIYPSKQIIEVLTADDRKLLTINDMLEGGALLPNFELPIRQLFPEPE